MKRAEIHPNARNGHSAGKSDFMLKLLNRVPKVITSPIRIRHSKTMDEDVVISVDGKYPYMYPDEKVETHHAKPRIYIGEPKGSAEVDPAETQVEVETETLPQDIIDEATTEELPEDPPETTPEVVSGEAETRSLIPQESETNEHAPNVLLRNLDGGILDMAETPRNHPQKAKLRTFDDLNARRPIPYAGNPRMLLPQEANAEAEEPNS